MKRLWRFSPVLIFLLLFLSSAFMTLTVTRLIKTNTKVTHPPAKTELAIFTQYTGIKKEKKTCEVLILKAHISTSLLTRLQ